MPVPAYTPPTKAISIPGSADDLVVRGLSLEDITSLVNLHLPDITLAVEQYAESKGQFYTTRGMDALLATMLHGFPNLAAAVIAQAAGDPDAVDQVRLYPVGAQIAALIGVADLTLNDMGALSDPSPVLASLVRQVTDGIGARTRKLLDTSGAPDAPLPDSPPQGA